MADGDRECMAMTPADLPDPWREWFEERAAIREFSGLQTREYAEAEALKETIRAMEKQNERE